MVRRISFVVFCLLLGVAFIHPAVLHAVELQQKGFAYRHFAGGRFGAWTGVGRQIAYSSTGDSFTFSRSSLYAEFFYSYRIAPALAAEASIGIFSRGDFRYYSGDNVLLGTVNMYPVFLTAKLYPFASVQNMKIYPYLQAGGGLVYGSQSGIDYYYGTAFTNASAAKLTYIVGGGIEWPVADQIGLCANYKYIPAKFGKSLIGVKDYSGWEISFGVGYIFGHKK